jgi:hypothetical protein
MSNPDIYFHTKTDLLNWFKINIANSYSEYLSIQEKIKKANFNGVSRLLKKEVGESVENFLSFLAELNLANLLLDKNIEDLAYEPSPGLDIDFSFGDIDLSAKNLGTKNYERIEYSELERLKEAGGGKNTISHKGFSDTAMEVEKNSMGTFTYSRIETGHSGFLDSEITQMSIVLGNIGKFESKIKSNDRKKVLFFLVQSSAFHHYHVLDAVYWYFGRMPQGYHPIFNNDLNIYLKLSGQPKKLNNINGLVFVFPPDPLIWPVGSLSQVIQEKRRALIYCNDESLMKSLETIFS